MIINNMTGGKKYPVTSPEGYINDKGYINGELSTIEKFKTAQGTFPSSGYTSIFYANNKYYSLNGNSNKVAISDDGIIWAESTMNINLNNGYYYNIAYGNGKFVVGRNNTFYVSDDCVNWTTVEMPAEEDSGSNWGGTDLPFGLQIWDIAYNNGKFVAIGSRESGVDGHGCLLTSSDGINWEEKYYAYSSWLVSGNGKFVLVLEGPGFLTYSEDGIIWDIADVEVTDYTTYLEYADDKFIFLDVASHKIYHSEDGVTWQESSHSTLSEQNYPSRISGADGLYMISYDDYAIISRDCINWELATEEWMLNAFSCNGKYVTIDGTTITYYDYIDEVVIPLPSNTYLDGVEYINTDVGVIEATEIIPTTKNQIIPAGNYLKGDQTIKGDANLVASNIAKGKNIFGVTGTYDPMSISNILGKPIKCIGYKEFSGSEANIRYNNSTYYVAALAANTSFTITCDQDIVAVCFWMYPGYTNGFAYWIFPTSGAAGVKYPYSVLGNSSATIPSTIPATDTNSHFAFDKFNVSTSKYTIGISGSSPVLTTSNGFLTINSRNLVWNNPTLLYLGTSSSIQTGAKIGLYAYGYS